MQSEHRRSAFSERCVLSHSCLQPGMSPQEGNVNTGSRLILLLFCRKLPLPFMFTMGTCLCSWKFSHFIYLPNKLQSILETYILCLYYMEKFTTRKFVWYVFSWVEASRKFGVGGIFTVSFQEIEFLLFRGLVMLPSCSRSTILHSPPPASLPKSFQSLLKVTRWLAFEREGRSLGKAHHQGVGSHLVSLVECFPSKVS